MIQCFVLRTFQLRDFIINQTTGDKEINVKYHYDNIVNYFLFFINYLDTNYLKKLYI